MTHLNSFPFTIFCGDAYLSTQILYKRDVNYIRAHFLKYTHTHHLLTNIKAFSFIIVSPHTPSHFCVSAQGNLQMKNISASAICVCMRTLVWFGKQLSGYATSLLWSAPNPFIVFLRHRVFRHNPRSFTPQETLYSVTPPIEPDTHILLLWRTMV